MRDRYLMSRVVNLVRQNAVKVSEQQVWKKFPKTERISLGFIKVSPMP